MNTKHLFLILTTVSFSLALQAQAYIDPAIKANLDAFIRHSNAKQWDKAFDFLYPKLFTRVPKQDLVDLMMGMEADGMSIQMNNTRVTSTTAPLEEGNETFVRVEYVADLTVTIATGGLYDSPTATQNMDGQFRTTYGKQNVKWDPSKKEFQILAHKAMMAIDMGDKNWKLVEINLDQPELMEYLFSPSIMDALVRVE